MWDERQHQLLACMHGNVMVVLKCVSSLGGACDGNSYFQMHAEKVLQRHVFNSDVIFTA
jgi:hypothetical protein